MEHFNVKYNPGKNSDDTSVDKAVEYKEYKNIMKQKIIATVLAVCFLANMACTTVSATDKTVSPTIPAITPSTCKASSKSIKISWSCSKDAVVKYYYVMRRSTKNSKGTGSWKMIARINSGSAKKDSRNTYIDKLRLSKPQQYEYKICTLSRDGAIDTREKAYAAETDSRAVLGTNIRICIDPGHYGSLNNNYNYSASSADGKYRYSEGKFTLKIGKALQAELKKSYGIDSYMTRTGNSISLTYKGKKYSNARLDNQSIAVRGYSAKTKDCDFFISLHTNATSRITRPWNQSKKINKVFIFTNKIASKSSRGMKIANSIGINLTNYNKKAKIQTAGFTTRNKNQAKSFSDWMNDSSNANGTVIFRKDWAGADYYGVLNGASAKGVEGIIVEHAFHVTQIVRKQAAASSALYQNWAVCDAYGIAYGLGFMKSQKL